MASSPSLESAGASRRHKMASEPPETAPRRPNTAPRGPLNPPVCSTQLRNLRSSQSTLGNAKYAELLETGHVPSSMLTDPELPTEATRRKSVAAHPHVQPYSTAKAGRRRARISGKRLTVLNICICTSRARGGPWGSPDENAPRVTPGKLPARSPKGCFAPVRGLRSPPRALQERSERPSRELTRVRNGPRALQDTKDGL